MRSVWDGFLSGLASIATLVICGVPGWFTFQAVQTGLAPLWAYAPLAGLVAVGLLMTFSFARKALRGVSPSRERRR